MLRFTLIVLLLLTAHLESRASESQRYALILADPPVAEHLARSKPAPKSAEIDYRRKIQTSQTGLRRLLENRQVRVTGSTQTLLNAVFVRAPADQAGQLRSAPGVNGVVPLRRVRMSLNRAVPLAGVPDAWAVVGGAGKAGAGMKIAIIDSGIDHQHPAFQDGTLPLPDGFPKCRPQDCVFTNSKIIAARSYVDRVAAGTAPNPAADSRPDDTSPRDRVGHGTAIAMAAAGGSNRGPLAAIAGVAPKAWLGNYKVFGSPSVNDGTSEDAIIAALEDALNDGMDVALLSLGAPAYTGPLDEGQACGRSPGVPCDLLASAVENAIRSGMTVVTAAGNGANDGLRAPAMATISSPATAPSAIAVGAVTNNRIFGSSVRVPGDNAPASLRMIPALLGDGPVPANPLTAPMRDVTVTGDSGLACSPLPSESLKGTIALIQRGTCLFYNKAFNAVSAGAVGVVFYLQDGDETLISPGGLSQIGVPALMVGNTAGRALRDYLKSYPDAAVTMDPALTAEVNLASFNTVASFSSRGPSLGLFAVKPEVAAVGTNVYTAAQRLDAGGILYDPSGYVVTQGTSFSAPLVAGAAALVKQKNPGFTPAQLRSAIVNTASTAVTDGGAAASVIAAGAGGLSAGAALLTGITVEPATLSFGDLRLGSLPLTQPIEVRNNGTTPLTVSLAVSGSETSPARLTLDKSILSIDPGRSETVAATLAGSLPAAGLYEGVITIQGGGSVLRAPYLFLVGDGTPYNIIPLSGTGFVLPPGEIVEMKVQVIDRFGSPVRNAAVQFAAGSGGGSIESADPQTDAYGVARAKVGLGQTTGAKRYTFRVGSLSMQLGGTARQRPAISSGGVVNAASFESGGGAAPGSYIAIFGTALSDTQDSARTSELPPGIGGVSVSFDVPAANLSLPGRLYFVSPGQVNVQVPWELAGYSSALIKVTAGDIPSELYQLPLARFSPALFQYFDSSARQYFAAALDEDNNLIGSGNGARAGRPIQLFLNGLGPVDPTPGTGEPTAASPLSRTLELPTVTIAGRPARVEFSGLTPTAVGLYQVNVVVPSDTPAGVQPLSVSIGGVTAKTVNLPVR